jgi:hypothetical protein
MRDSSAAGNDFTPAMLDQVLVDVCKHAATDPEFRKQCLTDAVGALSRVAGMTTPATLRIRFIDTDETVVRLPPLGGNTERDEMTEVAYPLRVCETPSSNCGMAVGRCSK